MHIKSDAELARILGVSRAVVCRAKQRGMPTDDVDAARAWRAAHLNPAHRKDMNPAKSYSGGRAGRDVVPGLLARVRALMDLAESAVGTTTFDTLRPALREAMRAIPAQHRPAVLLSVPVMDALLGKVLDALGRPDHSARPQHEAVPSMSADDADVMGRFWYALAAGEGFPAADLNG
jgi:hypothetical protein